MTTFKHKGFKVEIKWNAMEKLLYSFSSGYLQRGFQVFSNGCKQLKIKCKFTSIFHDVTHMSYLGFR